MKSSFRALVASAAVKEISIFIFTPPKSFALQNLLRKHLQSFALQNLLCKDLPSCCKRQGQYMKTKKHDLPYRAWEPYYMSWFMSMTSGDGDGKMLIQFSQNPLLVVVKSDIERHSFRIFS